MFYIKQVDVLYEWTVELEDQPSDRMKGKFLLLLGGYGSHLERYDEANEDMRIVLHMDNDKSIHISNF